ncbi:hypothetical protein DSECCO2_238690 [anaerobic digester metagenome]
MGQSILHHRLGVEQGFFKGPVFIITKPEGHHIHEHAQHFPGVLSKVPAVVHTVPDQVISVGAPGKVEGNQRQGQYEGRNPFPINRVQVF